MKLPFLNVIVLLAGFSPPLTAQTLFVPSGTSGISSSSNGNIGIGTSTPAAKLDVKGGYVTVSDSVGDNAAFIQGAGSVAYFGAIDGRRASFGNSENWETLSVDGGNAGVGQLASYDVRLVVSQHYPAITTSGTNYYKTVDLNAYGLPIAAGVTESGYRIGLGVQGYVSDTSFLGTLANQFGIWARHGANVSGAGSRIGNSYGIYIESLTNATTTIDNLYGVYQSQSSAKNYFAGNVGIGTTTPATSLEVNGDVAVKAGGHAYLYISGGTGDSEALWTENGVNRWALGMNVGEASQNFNLYNYTTGAVSWSVNKTTGNVGIGTTNPTQKLSVNGTIRAKEVIVDTGWSDYVFAKDYRLAPLSEVEHSIESDGHLPGMPSAQEVAEHGVSMGEMQSKLLAKVEELTLHLIRIEKENHALADQNRALAARVQSLEAR